MRLYVFNVMASSLMYLIRDVTLLDDVFDDEVRKFQPSMHAVSVEWEFTDELAVDDSLMKEDCSA